MNRWLLPEGIEEALPDDAAWLEAYRRRLVDLYRSWGYEFVMPPFIEYLESLLAGASEDLDLQTFKLTDQLTGRLMGVRADMTPQIARIDAHRINREGPVRLCYLGTVLTTRPAGFGGTRSPLQVGVELYGHEGLDSDREVLSLLLETMATCGVEEVNVDLGHTGIFREMSRAAGLDARQSAELFDMLQRKSVPEIDSFVAGLDASDSVRAGICSLPMLNGGVEALDRAREALAFAPEARAYIDALEALAREVGARYPDVTIHFDLAELSGYHYETGVVFSAYTSGEGQEIARGGRYHGIGKDFGRERPAVGFSADLKMLRKVSSVAFNDTSRRILAPCSAGDDALNQAISTLRSQGDCVVYVLDSQSEPQELSGCSHQLIKRDDQWVVEEIR
jgi:ATP phosphoribosyltransferase regulatory subunit